MASLILRQTIRDWLALGTVPFYDTVNLEQAPNDDYWCTVEWGFSSNQKLNYCGDREESGSFQVYYFGPVGLGDAAVLSLAESEIELLMSRLDLTGVVNLIESNTAEDFTDENYYGVTFLIEYECQHNA